MRVAALLSARVIVVATHDSVELGEDGPTHQPVELLAEREPGCPDVYTGVPNGDIDELDEDAGGASWWDFCETSKSELWSGWSWWDSDPLVTGDPVLASGATADGTRELIADAAIVHGEDPLWEFDGSVEESLHRVWGPGFDAWTWSSTVDGTFTGTHYFAGNTITPEGWRTDLYLFASEGDADRVEARGNVYLFLPVLHDRFDSMAMDLEIIGANGAGPDDCLDEPLGWIGLRDADAVWYDLVFLPRESNDLIEAPYDNIPLSVCDGCGTLYVRGVESGEVCMDFSWMLDGAIEPPDISEFVLPLRGLP